MLKGQPYARTIDDLEINDINFGISRLTDGTPVNNHFLLHIRAVANDRDDRTTEKRRFQTVVDIDAVFKSDITTVSAVNFTFMNSLEFFLHNHDFSKNLLPKPFRDLLEELIENKNSLEPQYDREDNISTDDYLAVKNLAIQVLEMYDSLVAEYKRIKLSCMQLAKIEEHDKLRNFAEEVNDFEELVEKLRDYFAQYNLYLCKGRFSAGWTLEQNVEATKAVARLKNKLTFDDSKGFTKLEVSERVSTLLLTLRDKLGAELSFFTDGTGTHALHLAEYTPGLGELIADSHLAQKSEEINPMTAKRADDERDFLSKILAVDLISIRGTTLPIANTATLPEVTRYTIYETIDSEFMPVSLLVFSNPNELNLAITIILKGGYAIYIRDDIEYARSSLDLEKVTSRLNDLEVKRLLFMNSID